MPERSGFPSAALGEGAARLGLPSGVRGVFGSGRLIHWARKIAMIPNKLIVLIAAPYRACIRSRSSSHPMLPIQLVFADAFHDFVIRKQLKMKCHAPWTRVHFR